MTELAPESRSDVVQDVRLDTIEKDVETLKEVAHAMGQNMAALTSSVEATNNLLKEFKDLMVKLAGGIIAVVTAVVGGTAVM